MQIKDGSINFNFDEVLGIDLAANLINLGNIGNEFLDKPRIEPGTAGSEAATQFPCNASPSPLTFGSSFFVLAFFKWAILGLFFHLFSSFLTVQILKMFSSQLRTYSDRRSSTRERYHYTTTTAHCLSFVS